MFFWLILLIVMLVVFVLSFLFITYRLCELPVLHRLVPTAGKKLFLVSLGICALATTLLGIFAGIENTVVIFIHLLVFQILTDLIFLVCKKIQKKEQKAFPTIIFATVLTVLYLSVCYLNATKISETSYTIETEKNVNGLRIVEISDAHVGTTFSGKNFADAIEKINKVNPDLVVIVGDFVDDSTSKGDMIDACNALGALKSTYGTFYVFGNHDKGYYGSERRGYNSDDMVSYLRANGVTVLEDEVVILNEYYYLVGRKDKTGSAAQTSRLQISSLLGDLDKDKYSIILNHQPNDYEAEAAAGADLVLSGHTHGGQLLPVNRLGELLKMNDATYGLSKRNGTNFIVSSGISSWAINFKSGCHSEFVVIDIKPSK